MRRIHGAALCLAMASCALVANLGGDYAAFDGGPDAMTMPTGSDAGRDGTAVADVGSVDATREATAPDAMAPDAAAGDGGGPGLDAASDTSRGATMKVFLSSALYTGYVVNPATANDGLKGADGDCTALAVKAGIGGSFTAWLRDPSTTLAARLHDVDGGWYLVDGTFVASGVTQLVADGGAPLAHPINETEMNATFSAGPVLAWTGATITSTCGSWTEVKSSFTGSTGNALATDPTWSDDMAQPCNAQAHLYCFQQ